MKNFVDRENELKFLNEEYQRDGSSLVILYGRRRIGKTAMASTFMSGKEGLYFLVTQESEQQNRHAFQAVVAEFCDNELLKQATVENWEILFKTLISKKMPEKLIIILDEFQYLGKSNPAFPSIFQKSGILI